MLEEIKKRIKELEKKLESLRGLLDLSGKNQQIVSIQDQMAQPNFWDDSNASNKLMKDLKVLKSVVDPFEDSLSRLSDLKEFSELAEEDASLIEQIQLDLEDLSKNIDQVEIQTILGGEFDRNNALLSINAGAGGTESCDWASMLLRMYTRWAENKKHKVEVLDILAGEEAGIKSATLRISGVMAYGFLKAEKGVHRLVRISPFDSNKRRHTSFASIDVIPEVEGDIEIDINMDDLRIDIFRSSGPGGQSVNTTDSAVRLTHIPTGIVVQCQNERSQLQNKESAMRVLKARLYQLRQKEQDEKMATEYGEKQRIEWGSQIRSYVFQPYCMVKDHRTSCEVGNVQKVMDGDLDVFIEAYLKREK
ncbi:MAG: peptide chain release factor 2 [Candidatus Omnitrophica bacterium]|nr:peptide chain release factor 2 [Candidatus Omnitrophota bacterium]